MLERDSGWRQGDLLTQDSSRALGLVDATDDSHWAVIITHDCDLPNAREATVEIIVATHVANPDSQLSYAKNPRRLHLTFECTGETPLTLELLHSGRHVVPKEKFVEQASREADITLPKEEKRTLKQWLAARYGRPAFPNAFENRLRKPIGKRTVERQIGKILEPDAKYLVGMFFDLGEQRGEEVAEGEPYALAIVVVYDATEGGGEARESAERVVGQLRTLFDKAYGSLDVATEIALDSCEAVADTYLTLADLRRVDQWRLEYISLSDDEQGDFLPVGELPG